MKEMIDCIPSEVFTKISIKAEPAERGAAITLFLPDALAPFAPGLLLAAAFHPEVEEARDPILRFSKQLANAFAGKHSDEKGDVL